MGTPGEHGLGPPNTCTRNPRSRGSCRTLRAFGLMTCCPRVTCPSPIKNCARGTGVSRASRGGAAVLACAPLCHPCAPIGWWSSGSACCTSRRSRYRWCAFCATRRPRTRGARSMARRRMTAPPRGRAAARDGLWPGLAACERRRGARPADDSLRRRAINKEGVFESRRCASLWFISTQP